MTLKNLMSLLTKIKKCHPEAAEAEVWAEGEGTHVHVNYVGYDKKHKPARIKLES
jgi:hypothetical protein